MFQILRSQTSLRQPEWHQSHSGTRLRSGFSSQKRRLRLAEYSGFKIGKYLVSPFLSLSLRMSNLLNSFTFLNWWKIQVQLISQNNWQVSEKMFLIFTNIWTEISRHNLDCNYWKITPVAVLWHITTTKNCAFTKALKIIDEKNVGEFDKDCFDKVQKLALFRSLRSLTLLPEEQEVTKEEERFCSTQVPIPTKLTPQFAP